MRCGEILALRWTDIDFKNRVLYVRRSVNRFGKFGIVVNDPKTKTSRRKITLAALAVEALQVHRTRQEQVQLQAGGRWNESGLVFPNEHGKFIEPNYAGKSFQRFLMKAELPHMRFHDLRHSEATILLAMGIPLKVVQELLGHSTIAMTADIYSHLLPSMQQDAMERLDEKFREDKEEDVHDDRVDQGTN